MARRNENPLGIRKLDVQEARRTYRAKARADAERLVELWLEDLAIPADTYTTVLRLVGVALQNGCEDGITIGAQATRDRVAEALASGELVKREDVIDGGTLEPSPQQRAAQARTFDERVASARRGVATRKARS